MFVEFVVVRLCSRVGRWEQVEEAEGKTGVDLDLYTYTASYGARDQLWLQGPDTNRGG